MGRPTPKATQAIADRFENFRAATEARKGDLERDHEHRRRRYRHLEEKVAGLGGAEREEALRAFARREEEGLLASCKVWTTADFEQVAVLGQGTFGVVHLVRLRGTEEYYALKQMAKADYRKRQMRARVFAERKLLAEQRSRWFVELLTTFQDADSVYMAMEFLQGGDLLHHLVTRGRFSPSETCFYMAELLEALDTVHRSGFIHRDVKPENMVLSGSGHLKLLDFGLCADQQCSARPGAFPDAPPDKGKSCRRSTVGTPQYVAPEMRSGDYGHEVDIWAFGAITFECLVGSPLFPLQAESYEQACVEMKFMLENHHTVVPQQLQSVRDTGLVPPSVEQLLLGVMRERERRLSAEECRREPFFYGIDFARLHLTKPPFDIEVSSPADAKYFKGMPPETYPLPKPNASELALKDEALEWARYEFDRRTCELQEQSI